ncbi:MAG: response regulator [Nitrospira sp.]|nr:response regulator [Nitrospira sp.]
MRPATILIIDDHAAVRTLLARVLEDAGYQVWEAANGREGLERFRVHPVDLVITDLEMPEMNGLEVIVELIRLCVDVRVIAMSGLSGEELQQATLIGARRTLPKPLDLQALLQVVHSELQQLPREWGAFTPTVMAQDASVQPRSSGPNEGVSPPPG